MLKLCLGYVSIFDIYLHNLSSILLLIFNFIEFLVHFLADSVVDPEVGEVHGTVVELEASASIDVDRAGVTDDSRRSPESRASNEPSRRLCEVLQLRRRPLLGLSSG